MPLRYIESQVCVSALVNMASFQVSLSWLVLLLVGEAITGTVGDIGSGVAPQDLMITYTANSTSITLRWEDINDVSVVSYNISYRTSSIFDESIAVPTIESDSSTANANGLIPRTSYTFELAVVFMNGTEVSCTVVTETAAPEGVGLLLNGQLYPNNTIVTLDEIGEGSAALFCLTNKTDCCRSSDTGGSVAGNWFFPQGGGVVGSRRSGGDIYRDRGPSVARLHRRNNALTTGVFRCVIPDASGFNETLHVGVYPGPNITYEFPDTTNTTTDIIIMLTCDYNRGNPIWMKDNVTLSNVEENVAIKENTEGSSDLTVSYNTTDDVTGNYTCIVRIGERSIANNIAINSIQVTGHEEPVLPGEEATITCSSDFLVETIEWLDSQNQVMASNSGKQLLKLNITADENGSVMYTCRVRTSRPRATLTQNITLQILDSSLTTTTDISTSTSVNTPPTGVTTALLTMTESQHPMTRETPSQDINVNIDSTASETGVGVVISLIVLLAAAAVITLTLIHMYRMGVLNCRRQTFNPSSSQKTGETTRVDSDEEREEPGYELVEVAHEYENPDQWNREYAQVSLPVQEGQQATGEYEFSQCPAYGTTNRSSDSTPDTGRNNN